MNHPRLGTIVLLLLSAALGVLIAQELNGFLAIERNEKSVPEVEVPEVRSSVPAAESLTPFAAIRLPAGALDDDLYTYAAADLAAALENRTGSAPDIVDVETVPGRVVVVRAADGDGEGYRLEAEGNGPALQLAVAGDSRLGAAYGMYRLADRLRSGVPEAGLTALFERKTPALADRYVDLGGVGIEPDPELWYAHDYAHHNRAFQEMMQPEAPFVDEAELVAVEEQFRNYVQRMIGYGYNGIIFNGFLEYVNFDKVGDGHAIYGPESEYRARHLALQEAFGRLMRYADEMGMRVLLKTDMLALTPPLQSYFEQELGAIDPADPRLWEVYRLGMAELYETLPAVDGMMIRIGEAGAIYNLEGWDYYSSLDVTTEPAVQTMLRTFAEVAARYDKEVVFRSWSVGVGEVGNMHTNPETYRQVLGPVEAPNLAVSTKYVMGDFYSYLPLNPTLSSGDEARIVEFQARREFEGFNAFPNYLGPLHQTAIQTFARDNPNVNGVWVWTQDGGPLRAGPRSLYPFHGFWQLIDDSVYATGRLAWEPDADLAEVTEAWVRRTFTTEPQAVQNLVELFFLSRKAVRDGFYIAPFRKQQVFALGLEPPPQMWIFEWDIVSGSNSALVLVNLGVGEAVDQAVAGGFHAVNVVEQMEALLAQIDPDAFHDPALYQQLEASLAYEHDLFQTLAWYRQAFLNYYHWLDTGEAARYERWQEALASFEEAKDSHLARYGRNLDFPAFNFFAVEAGMAHVRRSLTMIWLARGLLALFGLTLLAGVPAVQRRTPAYPGKEGLRALWLGLAAPWRPATAKMGSADLVTAAVWPFLLVFLARLTFSGFLSATYLLLYLLLLLPFAGLLLLLTRGQGRVPILAAAGGPLLLKNGLLLAVMAVRGPIYYWFLFWTDASGRTVYLVLSTMAGAWLLFALYATLRSAYGRRPLAALGTVLAALGLPLLLVGSLVQAVGLETAITAFNDEMAILPLGLSRILGITTHLGIPTELPLYVIGAGLVLLLPGLLLSRAGRYRLSQAGSSRPLGKQ